MKTLKTLVVLCSIILSVFLFADDDKYENHEYKKNHIYKDLGFLNLNSTQFKKMKKILSSYKHDHEEFYEYKEKQEKQLQNLIKSDSFDKTKYIKISQDIKEKATKIEADKLEKIHNLLNKKQRIDFSYYLQEWEVE